MVLPIYDDRDTNNCLRYLAFKLDQPKSTMDEVAAHLGFSRTWVYELLNRWRKDGTLDHCREIFMAARNQSIQSALDNVIDKWPLIVNRMVDDALLDANSTVRRKAAEFLRETVVEGYLSMLPRGTSEEQKYLDSTNEFSFTPTEIPLILQPGEEVVGVAHGAAGELLPLASEDAELLT